MDLTRKQIKKGIIISVSVSVVAIVLVIMLTQEDFSYSIFTRINPLYLLFAGLITVTFWILKTLKLQILANSLGGSVSFYKVFSIYIASAFVAHVTPSSSGGLPFEIYFLHREGLPLGQSTALTVLENMLTLIFFMITAPILLVAWGEYLNLGPAITRLFYIAVFLVALFIAVSLILIFNAHLAMSFMDWLTGLSYFQKVFTEEQLLKSRAFVEKEVTFFREGMQLLVKKKKALLQVLVYTVVYWIVYLSLAPVLLLGLGLKVAIPPVILAQLVFNFIQPIIPTPGGSGGAELGFAYLFKFMIPNYLLGIFVALWRFFMFYTSLIIGGFYFVRLVQGTDFLQSEEKI